MRSTTAPRTARQYADAVSAKDFATVTGLLADDIVWHPTTASPVRVAAHVYFSAEWDGVEMGANGVDLLRIRASASQSPTLLGGPPGRGRSGAVPEEQVCRNLMARR